jgi:hypothetical protein
VPIFRYLKDLPFGPEEITQTAAAYEQTLRKLGLPDRSDFINEIIAKKVIQIIQTGERNAACVSTRALLELGIRISA